MAIFFTNSILGRLEDHLWKKAKQRYFDENKSVIDDIKNTPKDVKRTLKIWVKTWQSEERAKIKIASKEFKNIVIDKTKDSLHKVISNTNQKFYSIEIIDSDKRPTIFTVPYEILQYNVLQALPDILASKIQFKDMLPETLMSLSEFAIEEYFKSVIHSCRKNFDTFKIKDFYYPLIIVDVKKADFYHLGNNKKTSRIDMIILSKFEEAILDKDKEKHVNEKEAIKQWNNIKNSTDGRADGRRFKGEGWEFPQSYLAKIS